MIIFNGEKYSCVSCIRGHRSSTCKHSDRMLVKVRTRGRPAPLDIRKVILVDKDSRVSGDHAKDCESPQSSQSCCGMNKQPILFLRAITTEKALLVNGDLKIMVTSESGTPDVSGSSSRSKVDESCKFVSEHDFLLNHATGSNSCCNSSSDEASTKYLDSATHEMKSEMNQSLSGDELMNSNDSNNHIYQDSIVELFTQKGAYLSTTCSCNEHCQCENCLIHRKEEELEHYLQELNQPLINLGNAHLMTSLKHQEPSLLATATTATAAAAAAARNEYFGNGGQNMGPMCLCQPSFCMCINCLMHPEEIISMSELLLYGLLNYKWKKKTVIKYKNKLIPSKYWWDFIDSQLPLMDEKQLRCVNMLEWFDNLVSSYSSELLDANQDSGSGRINQRNKHVNNGINSSSRSNNSVSSRKNNDTENSNMDDDAEDNDDGDNDDDADNDGETSIENNHDSLQFNNLLL